MHSLLRASALLVLLALAPSAFAQDLAPRVYPNPVADDRAVTVEVADVEAATVEVVDVLGRRISMDAPLAAGTYLVRVLYADGRATPPTSVTVASSGRVELRLVEALAPQAAEAATIASAPAPPEASLRGGCSTGDVLFAGFNHTALTGSLRLRPDLIPKSMRVQPADGSNVADFLTCFNSAQGISYRYVAGGDIGNRPLRVLSPAVVGNTQASFTANYTADGSSAQALYGTFEVFLDDDGDGGTPTVPAVQVGFDADFTPPLDSRETSEIANRGGAGYQLLVFNDEELVFEQFVSETTPLFVTPTGDATRVNMLRSLLLSSVVDGFDVVGASTAPGDLKAAFTFESGDGGIVNVHVGEGAPDAAGTTIHITPTFTFSDPASFSVSEVRTFTPGVNRYGVRAIQFAGGGGEEFFTRGGPAVATDGQWGRPQGEYVEPHLFDVVDAEDPFVFVSSAGPVEDFGIQFGREPAALQETGSEVIALSHGLAAARGFSGVVLDEDGDFYRGTGLVRNETDVQGETVVTTIANVGGSDTAVLVESAQGSFTTFEFVYDADADGDAEIRQNGTVGSPLTFSVSDLTVLASGAADGDPEELGSRQDFALAFVVERGGNTGVVYIFPDFASTNADVDVRSYAAESHEPFVVTDVQEEDQDDSALLREIVRSFSAAE